jgi:hypothetical protein
VGDSVTLRFDNNWVAAGNSVGFGFQNATTNLFEFVFVGGGATYLINDNATGRSTFIPWSGEGWDIKFVLVNSNEYLLTCGSYQVGGILKPTADMGVRRFAVWNRNAGSGGEYDLFVNDLRILQP